MIRVAVSEDQVLELIWRAAKPADRPEDGCLLARKPASISVNPSSPSIRKAFAIPIGMTCTPLITCFTAIVHVQWVLSPDGLQLVSEQMWCQSISGPIERKESLGLFDHAVIP